MAESLRGARVLVTGAAGFIGSHLTRRLLAEGADLHLLLRPGGSRDRIADLLPRLHGVDVDVADTVSVERAVANVAPEIVFHAAGATAGRGARDGQAGDLARRYEADVSWTARFLAALVPAMPRLRRVVRLGGLEEYGAGSLPYREDQREAPVSAYSVGQVAATHFAEMLHRRTGLPVVTLRPALVYGPGQGPSFFIPSLIDACLGGRAFPMTSGSQTRELVYVDDVVDAIVAAATATNVDGRIINVGSGHEYRIRDVAEGIVALTGAGDVLRVGALPDAPGDLARLVCDPSLAATLLQWRARTALDEGLAATIAYARSLT